MFIKNWKIASALGIFSVIVALGTIFVCIILFKDFDIKINVLSDLGSDPNTAAIFNSGLILSACLNLMFIGLKFKRSEYQTAKLCFLIALVSLCLTAIFKLPLHLTVWTIQRYIHWFFTIIYFVFYPLGIISYWNVFETDKRSLIIAIVALILPLFLFLINQRFLAEITNIIVVLSWVLYISLDLNPV